MLTYCITYSFASQIRYLVKYIEGLVLLETLHQLSCLIAIVSTGGVFAFGDNIINLFFGNSGWCPFPGRFFVEVSLVVQDSNLLQHAGSEASQFLIAFVGIAFLRVLYRLRVNAALRDADTFELCQFGLLFVRKCQSTDEAEGSDYEDGLHV